MAVGFDVDLFAQVDASSDGALLTLSGTFTEGPGSLVPELVVDDGTTRRRFAPIERAAEPEGGGWRATFPVPAELLEGRAVGYALRTAEDEAIDLPAPVVPEPPAVEAPQDDQHQRGLDALAQAREGFDVLAEVVAASREAVVDLERRLAAETRARQSASTLELALRARIRQLEQQQPPAPPAGRATKVLHSDIVGRAGAGVQRFARSAAAETARLRADFHHRSQEAAAELARAHDELARLRAESDGLRTERDGLRADQDGLRTELDGLRTERDELRGRLEAAEARVAELTAAIEAITISEPERPAIESSGPGASGAPTPMRFLMGADVAETTAVQPDSHTWRRVGLLLLVLGVVIAIALLVLTGYGAYCSSNPCG
jgi:hypothetical protein